MAQPSSSQRERERSERSSSRHHHHRTISSTTLLLVLSLVLAVLAVMLSLPSTQSASNVAAATTSEGDNKGILGIFSPKRSHALISRESDVAKREAEVARREAEILAGAPGGVLQQPPPTPVACPVCPTVVEKITEAMPAQTIIKEVVKEESLTPPGWWDQARIRAEDILDRELKIAEREREISRREEAVNRREHDATRRENWIMEQLVVINNEEQPVVEEEYIYEQPAPAVPKRKAKVQVEHVQHVPQFQALPPPLVVTETTIELATSVMTVTHTEHHTETLPTRTVTVPAPANTRIVASPAPESFKRAPTPAIPRTTSVERVMEEVTYVEAPSPVMEEIIEEEEQHQQPRGRRPTPRRSPNSWFGW